MNISENIDNLSFSQSVKCYRIIFRIDRFIAKTKMVSVQLGHGVDADTSTHTLTPIHIVTYRPD